MFFLPFADQCCRRYCFIILLMLSCTAFAAPDQTRPNIVLVLMDNLGWGEIGAYGGGVLRGAATPHIDSIAEEGLQLLNFNVESQCFTSRAALLTGRYAIRTVNAEPKKGASPLEYGLALEEYTLAEMLSEAGYATAIFGKWHQGKVEPTRHGFDEWYGIPNSTDESFWPDNELYRPKAHPKVQYSHVMAAERGSPPKQLGVFDSRKRLTIDREITDYAIDFMKRKAADKNPFFLYIPYTQTHMPVEPHPDNKGRTGNGPWADVLAQTDDYIEELLDTIDDLGIKNNTLFIFTSDNGPEGTRPYQGFSGPWRGSYYTGLEGSLRSPFLMRWPGKIPAKRVSNEIVHQMDLFATFARIAGGKVPSDRVIDSIDQTDFFIGKTEHSNRESVVIYNGKTLYGVKWRNWKLMMRGLDNSVGSAIKEYPTPQVYNLLLDPKEEYPALNLPKNMWIKYPIGQVLNDHRKSLPMPSD